MAALIGIVILLAVAVFFCGRSSKAPDPYDGLKLRKGWKPNDRRK